MDLSQDRLILELVQRPPYAKLRYVLKRLNLWEVFSLHKTAYVISYENKGRPFSGRITHEEVIALNLVSVLFELQLFPSPAVSSGDSMVFDKAFTKTACFFPLRCHGNQRNIAKCIGGVDILVPTVCTTRVFVCEFLYGAASSWTLSTGSCYTISCPVIRGWMNNEFESIWKHGASSIGIATRWTTGV
jgi:hypothetical protein